MDDVTDTLCLMKFFILKNSNIRLAHTTELQDRVITIKVLLIYHGNFKQFVVLRIESVIEFILICLTISSKV